MAKRISNSTPVRDLVGNALHARDTRTADERRAHGESLRTSVPLDEHATWEAPADRPDPVALLKKQGETRVQSEKAHKTAISRTYHQTYPHKGVLVKKQVSQFNG